MKGKHKFCILYIFRIWGDKNTAQFIEFTSEIFQFRSVLQYSPYCPLGKALHSAQCRYAHARMLLPCYEKRPFPEGDFRKHVFYAHFCF